MAAWIAYPPLLSVEIEERARALRAVSVEGRSPLPVPKTERRIRKHRGLRAEPPPLTPARPEPTIRCSAKWQLGSLILLPSLELKLALYAGILGAVSDIPVGERNGVIDGLCKVTGQKGPFNALVSAGLPGLGANHLRTVKDELHALNA